MYELVHTLWLNVNQGENKITCQLMNLAVPVNHRIKIKESKKVDKYLELVR